MLTRTALSMFLCCLAIGSSHAETVAQALARLDKQAAALKKKLSAEARQPVRLAALLSRSHSGSYTAATFSFEHGTRDDVRKTRNDWDLLYGNGRGDPLTVCTVTDDVSTIWDLGRRDFERFELPKGELPAGGEGARATLGHVYLIHTLDSESDLWIKAQVVALAPDRSLILRWEIVKDVRSVERIERRPGRFLKHPTVRLMLRGGAGGGNPNRAFMDHKTNAYVDDRSAAVLRMKGAVDINERHTAFIRGGYIPRGKVWIVRRISWYATATGDSNGGGEFLVQIKGIRIVRHENQPGPFQSSWTGRIVVRPGEEHRVFAEIANSSKCDVKLFGVLWDRKYADKTEFSPLSPARKREVDRLLAQLSDRAYARREAASKALLEMGPPILMHLRSVDTTGKDLEYRTRLARILLWLGGEK